MSALAAVCFHLAYAPAQPGILKLCVVGYIAALVQLARLGTTRQSFYFGLVTSLLCVAPQAAFFWKIFGMAAVPLWLILAIWIAGFVALSHLVLVRFGFKWALLLVPFIWTGLEYFRSELYYLRFSWLNVGYAFGDWQVFPTRTLGMYGIGMLTAFCATLFLMKSRWVGILGTAVLLAAAALLASREAVADKSSTVRIAGVQLEFPSESETLSALDQVLAKHPDSHLLVLSEYTLDGPVPDKLKNWCKTNRRHLIVGGKDPAPDGDYYNTAFVIGPGGDIVFRQVKAVPIQFFKDGLPAPRQALWESPWGRIGVAVCYDLSYSRVIDPLVKLGAQMLIVPTMDVADWGKRQHQLHALVAPIRANEYGIPIFRLASSGISQAVSKNGDVLARAGFPGQGEMLFATIDLAKTATLPIDRVLAPFSVAVTAGVIIALMAVGGARRSMRAISNASESGRTYIEARTL
jgi:apolipoprotein N-acyltransferase